eukprot:748144-Hanusia_phi.AAC.4
MKHVVHLHLHPSSHGISRRILPKERGEEVPRGLQCQPLQHRPLARIWLVEHVQGYRPVLIPQIVHLKKRTEARQDCDPRDEHEVVEVRLEILQPPLDHVAEARRLVELEREDPWREQGNIGIGKPSEGSLQAEVEHPKLVVPPLDGPGQGRIPHQHTIESNPVTHLDEVNGSVHHAGGLAGVVSVIEHGDVPGKGRIQGLRMQPLAGSRPGSLQHLHLRRRVA